jgi:hypothetical protein
MEVYLCVYVYSATSPRIDYVSWRWVPWNYPCRFLSTQFLFRSTLPCRSALVLSDDHLTCNKSDDGVRHPISNYWNVFLAKAKLGSSKGDLHSKG